VLRDELEATEPERYRDLHRRAAEVWARQLRWARLRPASFRNCYAVEILSGGVGPLLALAWVLAAVDWPVASVVALATIWYGALRPRWQAWRAGI